MEPHKVVAGLGARVGPTTRFHFADVAPQKTEAIQRMNGRTHAKLRFQALVAKHLDAYITDGAILLRPMLQAQQPGHGATVEGNIIHGLILLGQFSKQLGLFHRYAGRFLSKDWNAHGQQLRNHLGSRRRVHRAIDELRFPLIHHAEEVAVNMRISESASELAGALLVQVTDGLK